MTITIRTGGHDYFGWTSAEVTASIGKAARSFSVTMAEMNIRDLGESFWVAPGDDIQVLADDIVVLDGFVNEYKPSFDANAHSVTISGRGKSQDSVDCSAAAHPTGRFENLSVQAIANELAGIVSNTVTSTENTPVIRKFQVNQGETIIAAIHRLAHAHGFSVMGNADGSMSLVRGASSDRFKGVYLEEGRWPLLRASATISDHAKFSDYEMKSQLNGSENRFGVDAASEVARVKDATVTRYRPYVGLMSVSTDSQTASTAADWRARRIAGKGVNVDVTVQGFQYGGELWQPNKLIYISAPTLRLEHELLIESVTYRLDDSGSRTDLKLVPPKAAKSSGGAKKSGGDGQPTSEVESAFDGSTPETVVKPKVDLGEYGNWSWQVGPQ
jgi:prophage tail gpP-like protein